MSIEIPLKVSLIHTNIWVPEIEDFNGFHGIFHGIFTEILGFYWGMLNWRFAKSHYGPPPVIILIFGWDCPCNFYHPASYWGTPMTMEASREAMEAGGARNETWLPCHFLRVDVRSIFYWNLWRKSRNLENLDSYDSTTTIPECFGLWLVTCSQTHRVAVIGKKREISFFSLHQSSALHGVRPSTVWWLWRCLLIATSSDSTSAAAQTVRAPKKWARAEKAEDGKRGCDEQEV